MSRLLLGFGLALALAGWLLAPAAVLACPLCNGGVNRTLSDDIKVSEAAAIARLVGTVREPEAQVEPGRELKASLEVPRTRFEIEEVLKGEELLKGVETIEMLYFGEATPGTPFLMQANRLPELAWGMPVPLSERALDYVRQLASLPEKGPQRLSHFREYFEDEEHLLANDAFEEFAKASYDDIKAVKDQLPREKFAAWITAPETTTTHRRLYLMLLGVCARDNPTPEELAMLEEAVAAPHDPPKMALDATIACYLTLTNGEGLPLVEEHYLKDKDCPYSDTYSAIMALRFHGQDEQIIPRERVLVSLRLMLDRPELADLIIPDLARWQDWSAMERLVTLFKEADDKTSWVRVPVVQYLKACPLPEAKEHIKELAQIDPKAVKRASLFVPLGGGSRPVPAAGQDAAGEGGEAAGDSGGAGGQSPPAAEGAAAEEDADNQSAQGPASVSPGSRPDEPPGSPLVVAVPAALGLGLLALLALNLRGEKPRAT